MKAGDLRYPITIQRQTKTTDNKGNRVTAWTNVCACNASVADVSGRDFYAAQAYQAQDVVTFGIRWRNDLDTACRILFNGGVYKIEQINHLGYRGDYIHIKARQTVGEG